MPKKTTRPRRLSGAGRGKWAGACILRGPVHPVTNSKIVVMGMIPGGALFFIFLSFTYLTLGLSSVLVFV